MPFVGKEVRIIQNGQKRDAHEPLREKRIGHMSIPPLMAEFVP